MATNIVIGQGRLSKSICRLCFMEREHYQSIFERDHTDLAEWIGNLTSLKLVNVPNAPASLCLECKSTLKAFESFREMCHTNDRVFKEMFFHNGSQAKVAADPLDFPTERTIKVERSESPETGIMDFIANNECSIAAIDPEVESSDISKNLEDVKIEIEENPPDCEEKTEAKTIKPIKSKNRPKKDQPIQCEVCSKSFTTKDKLRFHIRYHNKKHFCSYCNKAFRGPDHLKSHIRTHTGEKPFKCEKCEKSFNEKRRLNLHVLSYHGGIREHSCDLCHMEFSTYSHLKRHKQSTKHQPYQHSYICEMCNVKFSTAEILVYHKRYVCGASTSTFLTHQSAIEMPSQVDSTP